MGKYYNKTQVLYRLGKDENIHEKWEKLMKERKSNSIKLSLLDQNKNNLFIVLNEELKKNIVKIEEYSKEGIYDEFDDEVRKSVIFESLIDEAYQSSLIEGAFTTKKKTEKMIKENLKPKDKSERMVLNNFHALKYILENKNQEITEDTILEIYKLITKDTLSKDEISKKYREGQNEVSNYLGDVIYTPPQAEDVQWMMDDLIKFLYKEEEEIHPILKAIIFHYFFVYVHPFYDGNGRTARAITYMYLIQQGYTFFQYFSISSLIAEFRKNYYTSIKNSEDYDSDVTYFALFYSEMIIDSILKMQGDFKKHYLKKLLNLRIQNKGIILNKRQEKAIEFMLRYSKSMDIKIYTTKINKVVQETARRDLNDLVEYDLLEKIKSGKRYIYKIKDIL